VKNLSGFVAVVFVVVVSVAVASKLLLARSQHHPLVARIGKWGTCCAEQARE